MILSKVSGGTSKPSNSALAKAAISSRLSLSSLSTSYFLKNSLRSWSFFRAAALRAAFSLEDATALPSFSNSLLPLESLLRYSSISRSTLRAALPTPISLHFSSRDLMLASIADLHSSITFSVAEAASTMASGVPSWPSGIFFAASWASVTFASAAFTSPVTSSMSRSTFSASSLALRSSSARRRSSSARFSLISSMRRCACCSVCSASCETFSLCEPKLSKCVACASSSSARRLS
mmetsp:Transcript_114704/g.370669  ORF Transcript_114704/g.370669 Transcript_114704/m.370669 type:complete len:236 (-) Transcript_114704:494-1201(-)